MQQSNLQREEPNLARRVERHIQGRILAGLMQLVPIVITGLVLSFFVSNADAMVRPLPFIGGHPWDVPGIGLSVVVIILYVVGLSIATSVGRRAMDGVNTGIGKIPVVRTIFNATAQMTSMVASDFNFSRVVFLEWPRDGMVAMGFVTGRIFAEDGSYSMASVYIPTVPNPTSGNMAFVNEDDLFETDIKVEDAVKLVLSGGIVLPNTLALVRIPRENRAGQEYVGRFNTHPL